MAMQADDPKRFVIQQHDATRMHYDLRLEVDGVLVSWAVPRGPSMDPAQKRLAVMTEDHSMDHAGYEGPNVIVWDRGTYHNLTTDERGDVRAMREAIDRGHVKVWLDGEKLQGAWALHRTDDPKRQWLLVKVRDAAADPLLDPVRDDPRSILSGRTL